MDSGKTLAHLAVCLSFWIGIVLLILSSNGNFNFNAIATPITTGLQEQSFLETKGMNSSTTGIVLPGPDSVTLTEIAGELQKGESFDQAMKRLAISDAARIEIIRGFGTTLDFRVLQPGDRFTLFLDQDDTIARATYESGLLNTHILERNADGNYWSTKLDVPLECRVERLSGIIDSSLYSAFAALGEEPKLIHAYADIFASKIDFNTETQTGDSFELLVEKYFKDDIFVGYGKILLARYQQKDTLHEAYHFVSQNTPPGYFDGNGEALGTWFIRSPIPFGRVTSRFTMQRRHPVDGVVRPHLGVDLAAPVGTPVMATAEGKVEYIGNKGGFGKTVILRHNGGYQTYYGHLSNYKKGLKKGSAVGQKDIIGYVGSTGVSTGPHLDYRIQVNGVFKNPFGVKFKARTVLAGAELDLFLQSRTQIAALLNTESDGKILQVRTVTLTDDHVISFL